MNLERIITGLGVLKSSSIKPSSTLIVFDEIQFCPQALTFLKYLYEKAPDYHLACAGSLLGITLTKPSSFPVSKVDFLTQVGEKVIPVEVKASTNLRSRSLAEYRKRYSPEIAIRASLANLKREEGLLNLPLYLLFALKRLV